MDSDILEAILFIVAFLLTVLIMVILCCKRAKRQKKQALQVAQFPIDFNRIQIIDLLGSGNFSYVYLVWFRPTLVQSKLHKLGTTKPIRAAAKLLVPQMDSEALTYFGYDSIHCVYDEMIVRKLEHENILRIYGLCRNFEISDPLVTGAGDKIKTLATLYEYMDLGDCQHFIENRCPCFAHLDPYRFLFSVCLDVSNALVYLEEMRIVHRDIAPRNIFLRSKDRSNRAHLIAKMGDFGLANEAKTEIAVNGRSYFGCFGRDNEQLDKTIMAPEAKNCHLFTSKSDVYSFGLAILDCLQMIQMSEREARQINSQDQCNPTAPFHGQVTNVMNYSPVEIHQIPFSSISSTVSESRHIFDICKESIELKDLAVLCMKYNMADRISPRELRSNLEILLKTCVEPRERV